MKTKEEALRLLSEVVPAPTKIERVPLALARGRVLAEDVHADRDMPAFHRSAMDGWAVRAEDLNDDGGSLRIVGRIMAGSLAERPMGSGETMKIMTGAPLPDGADSVVMVEWSEENAEGTEVSLSRGAVSGQNVAPRGQDHREGELILRKGRLVDSAEAGLLAMVGCDPVPVFALPTVTVIPTGDELVEPSAAELGASQIRESNGFALADLVQSVSPRLRVLRPGIARDDLESLEAFLKVGLEADVLILSGGVSMGDLDLVGPALLERGLEVMIEKVSIKPGKPLLFGRVRHGDHSCWVFGLPGNPVSSFLVFEVFVRSFLKRLMGAEAREAAVLHARLFGRAIKKPLPRTQHVPACIEDTPEGPTVRALEWHGSGDFRALADANGFIVIEADAEDPGEGSWVPVQLVPGRTPGAPLRPSRPWGNPAP